jgi:hypothetical protein
LGGWTEGLIAEGYRVVGFDIEQHVYGEARYPSQLVLQDVLTIHGAQFKSASLIVASPPCQAYSYRAMPWKRAKALPPPDNSLFEACFRIQAEACAAAGHHIPLVVENVRGAQPWVGRARWHFGSFYLWGDVPALMPMTKQAAKVPMPAGQDSLTLGFTHTAKLQMRDDTKNDGGSWFAVAHNTTSGHGRNPDGRRVRSDVSESQGEGAGVYALALLPEASDGIKQGGDWFNAASLDGDGMQSISRRSGSKSSARKAASAHIAKIPLVLARHIARSWKAA